jgi:mRNA interferase HicA
MKHSDFIKWLREQGCEIRKGKGSHVVATNPKSRTSMAVPTHGKSDIPEGTRKAIIKYLDL